MSAKKPPDHDGSLTKELTILNKLGIHARPAAAFVRTANRFSCDIFVERGNEKVNGKSIMGLLMLAAGPGTKLTIHAQGPDARAAIGEIDQRVAVWQALHTAEPFCVIIGCRTMLPHFCGCPCCRINLKFNRSIVLRHMKIAVVKKRIMIRKIQHRPEHVLIRILIRVIDKLE